MILLLICGQPSLQSVVHSNWHYGTYSSACKCAAFLKICAEFSSKNIMLPVTLSGEISVTVNCQINIILICPSQLYILRKMLHVCDCVIIIRLNTEIKCIYNATHKLHYNFVHVFCEIPHHGISVTIKL